jgi:hypothetical protein
MFEVTTEIVGKKTGVDCKVKDAEADAKDGENQKDKNERPTAFRRHSSSPSIVGC